MTRDFDPARPELMDQPGLDPALLKEDLLNLRRINRWFGGWTAADLLFSRLFAAPRHGRRVFVDVCTGSADLPLRELARRPDEDCLVIAVDFSEATIAEAKRLSSHERRLVFVRADARALPFQDAAADGVACALALHHFSESDATQLLRELARVSRGPVGVSDLVRGRVHLLGAWLLTRLLLRNPITRHDAVASVRRAFSCEELQTLAARAGWAGAEHVRIPLFRQAILRDAPGIQSL